MTTREHLIESLRRLCSRSGGYKEVADRAGVDDQSLYQIISGVKLPSGNPKGVGPTIQAKLDNAFPGWSEMPLQPSHAEAREERAHYNAARWPFRRLSPSVLGAISDSQLAAIEEVLAAAVSGMTPDEHWRAAARTHAAKLDQALRANPSFQLGADPFTRFVLEVEQISAGTPARKHARADA